jgi:4-hydroxy-3-methylbut-2-enyl diphosphate reductase
MVVVGGRHSSNTRKLYEIAQNYCKNVLFIENKCEISLKDLCGCNKIGVTAGASTPERIVKEVISSMSEFRSENYENNPMHEYMDEIDKSTRLPRNGDVVTGEVILVTDNDVTINLGCKKDGVIPRYEVSFEEGQTMHDVFKEGDEVQAKVLKNDDGEGNILLSKKRVIVSEHWETISQACDDKTPLEVRVTREVNGGVIAAFNEVNGFIPLSQLSDHYVEKADEFVGQTLVVKVIRVDQKRNKVVFSHKAVLHEARQKRMQEIWESLSVGDVIDGKVMRFTEYGAFVDIGGVDGLLHISEISWGKLRHPSDLLGINQEIKVKILSMNKEKEKISLGYKQNQPEPWSVINQKYTVGQVISGRAVQIKDYGVFVEIEPGLDGLVHISEIAYRRVTDISDELDVGQLVSAKILEIDQDRKRISLSIKETLDKPSDDNEVFAVAGAEPGDPSTEGFDPDKDQEFEIPDPDGLDVAEADADAVEAEMEIEVEAIEADAEIEIEVDAIEADAEVEVEIEVDADAEIEIEVEAIEADAEVEIEVDAIGADAEVEIEVETAAVDAIAEADPGDPSTEAFDPDKDQEFEIPDPDGADAAEAKDDEA